MKVDMLDNTIIIYLKKKQIKSIDFNNIDNLEKYFKELVIKLNNLYHIKIEGFYNIRVYIDDLYGMVLEFEPEDIDYCLNNDIEMRISIMHEKFLYEIYDLVKIDDTKIIKKGLKSYFYVNNKIEYKNYLKVLENTKIIYKNTENIIKYGNVIIF